MSKRILPIFVVLLASLAWGQYSTKYNLGRSDLTYYAPTVNLWKLVAGGQVCQANSLSLSYDAIGAWCVGSDTYGYSYNTSNQTWTKNTTYGSGLSKLIFSASGVWSLKTNNVLYWWSGTEWVWKKGQLSNAWAGADGTLFALTKTSGVLSVSADSGKTWTAYSGAWLGASVWDAYIACAVNTSHQLYVLDQNSAWSSFSTQPPGSPVGCIDAPATSQDAILFAVWDAAGAVHEFNNSTGAWFTVTGLSASQLVGRSKKRTLALDSGGHPYHWNVNAPSVSGNMTGQWTAGCPGPGQICNPGATHTGNLTVKFSSGHGLDGHEKTQTIPYNGAMNLTASDQNPGCDPMYGVPTDVECYYVYSGGAECNQSGANLGGGDSFDNMIEGESTDFENYLYHDPATPVIIWPPDLAIVQVKVHGTSACEYPTIPTCDNPWFYIVYEGPLGEVSADLATIPLESPWMIFTDYTIDVTTGDTFCAGYGIGQEIVPTYGSSIGGPCN